MSVEVMRKRDGLTCTVCKVKVRGSFRELEEHGAECHPDHVLYGRAFVKKVLFNPLTGRWHSRYRTLSEELNGLGVDKERFFLDHCREHMRPVWERNLDAKYGDARNRPECIQCGRRKVFREKIPGYHPTCSEACSATWHAANTNTRRRAMETIRERKKVDPKLQQGPMHLQYWLDRGLSETEAKEKVRERQATNSLKNFIRRHGEEEGRRRWQERQQKWQNTLNSKSEEEKLRIAVAKSTTQSGKGSISKICQQLFESVSVRFDVSEAKYNDGKGNHEIAAVFDGRIYRPDFVLKDKIIEFFGDWWHFNPNKFSRDQVVRQLGRDKLVGDVWDRDAEKLKRYEAAGYKVLVIWESDYREDPNGIVERCVEFLRS